MGTKPSLQDWDGMTFTVLEDCDAVHYERREAGGTVRYVVFDDAGVEIGRFTISMWPEGVRLGGYASVLRRAVTADGIYLSDDERARHELFVELERDIKDKIRFRHGLGEWAEAWKQAKQPPQPPPVTETIEANATERRRTGPQPRTCEKLLKLLLNRTYDLRTHGSTPHLTNANESEGVQLDDKTLLSIPQSIRKDWTKRTFLVTYDDFTALWSPERQAEFREWFQKALQEIEKELEKSERNSGRMSER